MAKIQKTSKKKKELEEIPITLSDDEFLQLALMAHERDITFNQLCNDILKEMIEKLKLKDKA